MTTKVAKIILYVLSGIVISFVPIPPTLAQERAVEFRGLVREFDPKQGTMTLYVPARTMRMNLNLSKEDLPCRDVRGRTVKLEAIKPGMRIRADVVDEEEILSMRVEAPVEIGNLVDIDLAKRSVKVRLERTRLVKTWHVPEDVQIMLGRDEIKLEQLKIEMPIDLHFTLDGKSLLQIRANQSGGAYDMYRSFQRLYCIVLEKQESPRSLRLLVQSDGPWEERTYEIDPDLAGVLLYHNRPLRAATFDDVARYMRVSVLIEKDTQAIYTLEADLAETQRLRIMAFDKEKRLIKLADEKGEKEWPFSPELKIYAYRSGKMDETTLAEIEVGQFAVCGLAPDRQSILGLTLYEK